MCVCVCVAVQVSVLDMETVGDWAKFAVSLVSVYKSRGEPLKRGDHVLWVHMKDLACKCPRIHMGKRFLILGTSEGAASPERPGLLADKNSLVIQWRDIWTRRLRKFQRKEKKGKCGKAWWDDRELFYYWPLSCVRGRLRERTLRIVVFSALFDVVLLVSLLKGPIKRLFLITHHWISHTHVLQFDWATHGLIPFPLQATI